MQRERKRQRERERDRKSRGLCHAMPCWCIYEADFPCMQGNTKSRFDLGKIRKDGKDRGWERFTKSDKIWTHWPLVQMFTESFGTPGPGHSKLMRLFCGVFATWRQILTPYLTEFHSLCPSKYWKSLNFLSGETGQALRLRDSPAL